MRANPNNEKYICLLDWLMYILYLEFYAHVPMKKNVHWQPVYVKDEVCLYNLQLQPVPTS